MKKTYPRWHEVRQKKLSAVQLEAVDRQVEQELIEMDLHAIRALTGKTQTEVAAATDMTQSEVSQLERRPDVRLSTLKRYVEALGGEVEIFASFGDKRVRVRVRAAG